MSNDTQPEAPALRCLAGGAPPPEMADDLRQLIALPRPARKDFWIPLRAYLRPELDDDAEAAITGYCEKHELTPPDIASPIRATRHLFRQGARHDASPEDLAADVTTLLDIEEAQDLLGLFVPWYEDLVPHLRRLMVRQTVTDHGKLVTGTRWRLEHITSSDRAEGIDMPVAMVTFSYVDGAREQRTTLCFLPDQLAALRDATQEMLS